MEGTGEAKLTGQLNDIEQQQTETVDGGKMSARPSRLLFFNGGWRVG